jgi:hypothetical protein
MSESLKEGYDMVRYRTGTVPEGTATVRYRTGTVRYGTVLHLHPGLILNTEF